ncbi:MAG: hypothetical protein KJ041_06230, partial [Gammaproteobacteria bacterium]|nr:hypothetical protein [Gammaproteobacteria bacterium]
EPAARRLAALSKAVPINFIAHSLCFRDNAVQSGCCMKNTTSRGGLTAGALNGLRVPKSTLYFPQKHEKAMLQTCNTPHSIRAGGPFAGL